MVNKKHYNRIKWLLDNEIAIKKTEYQKMLSIVEAFEKDKIFVLEKDQGKNIIQYFCIDKKQVITELQAELILERINKKTIRKYAYIFFIIGFIIQVFLVTLLLI